MNKPSFLTKEGAQKLRAELKHLEGPVRQELAKRLRSAIQMGDLSENADYSAAKEEQAFIEGRIQELTMVLRDVVIIEDNHTHTGTVQIGSTVTIQEDQEEEETFHIVGPQEADPRNGKISYDSPIGQALIGHQEGEKVTADTPGGALHLRILKVK
ncbi:MAG TPA: transcription elongation factor GreA [Anaerolineaceae bacterium]|nr:transcription elongation factor GreA [Anaerolineaceae bacterium]